MTSAPGAPARPEPRVGGHVTELRAERVVISEERAVPTAGPGEALVRIVATGVCGTDVHAFRGRMDHLPITLGHDAVGIVEQVGPADAPTALAVGQRVTLDPMIWCGTCDYCRHGMRQLCRHGGYLGMNLPGTMAEYLALPARNVVPLDDGVSTADGTVLEPVAVALHVLERIGTFAPDGLDVDVVGGGPLGVVLAQTLAARGWTPTVYETQAHRRDLGRACGLDVREPADARPRVRPGLVVETSASAGGIGLVRTLAAPGSIVALVGRAPAELTSAEILENELTVMGMRAGVGCYPAAVELVAGHPGLTPAAVVTHRHPLAEVAAALAECDDPAAGVMRSIVHVSA